MCHTFIHTTHYDIGIYLAWHLHLRSGMSANRHEPVSLTVYIYMFSPRVYRCSFLAYGYAVCILQYQGRCGMEHGDAMCVMTIATVLVGMARWDAKRVASAFAVLARLT